MPSPTPIYKSTCKECDNVSYVFFIPAEGQAEIYPAPCDKCGNFVSLEIAHPENIPGELSAWNRETKKVQSND